MSTTKGRPPTEIDPSLRRRLDLVRHAAHQRVNPYEVLDEYKDKDILEQLAWATGLFWSSQHPDAPHVLGDIITQARNANRKWREISIAMGEGDNDIDARRVMKRYIRWIELSG